ncbi:transmembrane protein 6/97 [Chlamydoabsidia padenii]|nr:transmembrane protein 6/97 [Chlamydoabsidia padenii]
MATSLFKRPLDLVYFIYFFTHIPVTLMIDFQIFYPPHLVPQALKDALIMYIRDYKDPFIGANPPLYWFMSFMYSELLFQFIFFFIACYGLWKDSTRCRLGLCIYGSHVATTVFASLFEVLLNPAHHLTSTERYTLSSFYLPYFIIPVVMVVDSYCKLSKLIANHHIKKVN